MTALDELILSEKEKRRYENWKLRRELEMALSIQQRVIAQCTMPFPYGAAGTSASGFHAFGTTMQSVPPSLQSMAMQPASQSLIPAVWSQPKPRQLAQGMARPDPDKIFPVWRFDGTRW